MATFKQASLAHHNLLTLISCAHDPVETISRYLNKSRLHSSTTLPPSATNCASVTVTQAVEKAKLVSPLIALASQPSMLAMSAGQDSTGLVVSSIMIVAVHVVILPQPSVAVKVTSWVPVPSPPKLVTLLFDLKYLRYLWWFGT